MPQLPQYAGPAVLSAVVVVFAIAWPVVSAATPRWPASIVLAVTGLLGIWVVSLLPSDTVFSARATELWLAPVAGAAALGVLLMFLIQIFHLPGGLQRILTTALLTVGAVIAASSAGWALVFRHKFDAQITGPGFDGITGLTWLLLTVLAGLVGAALVTVLPMRRAVRMVLAVIVATVIALVLQWVRPSVLSAPAVVAAVITGLIVALGSSFAGSKELAPTARNHPMTAVAAGSASTIVAGMISYFAMHALPW